MHYRQTKGAFKQVIIVLDEYHGRKVDISLIYCMDKYEIIVMVPAPDEITINTQRHK